MTLGRTLWGQTTKTISGDCCVQVCALLETCGCYFNEGAARKHLDRFLTFLQAYLLSKPTLPLDVDFDLQVGDQQPTDSSICCRC